MSRVAGFAFCFAVLCGLSSGRALTQSTQTPRPQFRAGVETVPVYATVRDSAGRFVLDLTQADFEVRDNGAVQPITVFTTDIQPLSVVLLLDGSGSMMASYDRVIEGANSFILRMLPEDRARVGSFSDRVLLGAPFTSDRDELLAFVRNQFNLTVGLQTHLWEAVVAGARALDGQPGKRVVLVLSDGYNFVAQQRYQPTDPGRNPFGGQRPRGLPGVGRGGGTGGSTSVGTAPLPEFGGGITAGTAQGEAIERDALVYAVSMWVVEENTRVKPSRDLQRVALETGGSYYELREYEDLNPTFTRIMQELRQQYVLGFVPKVLDGKAHKLEVRVRRKGLDVQARRSYVAGQSRQPPR